MINTRIAAVFDDDGAFAEMSFVEMHLHLIPMMRKVLTRQPLFLAADRAYGLRVNPGLLLQEQLKDDPVDR